MTCTKCGFENVKVGSPCPGCAAASPSSEFDSNNFISQDFLLGNTKIGLERIRSRLLDLTNRNRLLNFRHTPRSSLSIVGVLPDALFDRLIDGDAISFKPVPEPNGPGPKPKVSDYARQIGLPTLMDLPEPGTLPVVRGSRSGQAQTLHYPNDLEAILRRISYAARTAIEESGTKMLHLIFGFLEWFESESSDQPHLAPLVLVPVTIEKGRADRTSGTYIYETTYSSTDQIEENLSLREKLKRDFGLDMPELSDEETPESYFLKFKGILADKPHWRLRRRITLGLVYVGKLLMFRDLDPKNWPKGNNLIEHPRPARTAFLPRSRPRRSCSTVRRSITRCAPSSCRSPSPTISKAIRSSIASPLGTRRFVTRSPASSAPAKTKPRLRRTTRNSPITPKTSST